MRRTSVRAPVISVRRLGRGAEPLLPLKEALASHLGRDPDQGRRTLARAAPHLLDAVPFIGAFLASIGEKLAEGSFSCPPTGEWPRGAASDDTALTLLVAHHLADRDGDGDPGAFLAELAKQEPEIRSLGPTTANALATTRTIQSM